MDAPSSKRILVLTPRFPFPIVAGDTLRIVNMCKELATRYTLTLLSLCDPRKDTDFTAQQDIFDTVYRVPHSAWRGRFNTLKALPSARPLQVAYYNSAAFQQRVHALVPEHDLVLAHLLRAGQFAAPVDTCPCILEMTDALSLNYQRVSELGKWGIKHLLYRIEENRIATYEQQALEYFDLVTLVSEVDRKHLAANTTADADKIKVYTNGIDLSERPYQRPAASPTIVFIGNMRTVHNQESCIYFAKKILPKIQIHIPGARFRIVGHATEKVRHTFSKFEGVDITGWVDSIPEASRDAIAGMGIMQVGAGVQNKILEYMALGLPVIANKTGMEGIEAEADTHFLQAETTQEAVDCVLALHESERRRNALAQEARSFVQRQHEWKAVLSGFVDDVEDLLRKAESHGQ